MKKKIFLLSLYYKTDAEKALFVSGMGLHTQQDYYAHDTDSTGKHTDYSDKTDYDYNETTGWTNTDIKDFSIEGLTFTGGQRYIDTIQATSDWIDELVDNYGDDLFGYTPDKKSKK